MDLAKGLFTINGNVGYVLKPEILLKGIGSARNLSALCNMIFLFILMIHIWQYEIYAFLQTLVISA